MRGADIIVDYLVKEGVPYAVGLCGHGIIGFMDALYDRRDDIKTISVHHEQVAGYIADAYFRVSHRPLATFTSCGPGSTNLVIALAASMMDAVPFLAITGNVPTDQFNRGPFQETYRFHEGDFPAVIRPYVKRSFQPTRPEMLPLALRQAFKTMLTGRPGPVNLDVPLNVFVEETDQEVPDPALWWHGIDRRSAATDEAVRKALDLLLGAQRPLIVVDQGATLSEAAPEVRQLAEELGIPVAHNPLGAGVVDSDHELCLGALGRNGTLPANQAARSADVILALGVHFDDRTTSAWIPGYTYNIPPAKLIHVDLDEETIGRNYPVHLGIRADVKTFVAQLLRLARQEKAARLERAAWHESILKWKQQWVEYHEGSYRPGQSPIQPEHVIRCLRQALPRDGILAVDVGVHHNWIVQRWRSHMPQTLLQSWGFAAMGYGAAGVLGAKLAAPDRPAVALVGDGGFLMVSNVVATAVEYNLPVVWVVWNNRGYVSIRDLQRGAFRREIATMFALEDGRPYSPDFAALGRAYGADGFTVTDPSELADVLQAAIRSERPTVVDVIVDTEQAPVAVGTWRLPPLPHPEPNFPGLAGDR